MVFLYFGVTYVEQFLQILDKVFCSASFTTQDFQFFVSLLSRRICANNFHVQVVHLSQRVVHGGIEPDHPVMALLRCVHLSVPIIFVDVYLV